MSQKFGLDWKKYEAKRMQYFITILVEENKKKQK